MVDQVILNTPKSVKIHKRVESKTNKMISLIISTSSQTIVLQDEIEDGKLSKEKIFVCIKLDTKWY